MDMQALLIFQIIADIVLCGVIVFLLMRFGKVLDKSRPPLIDEKSLLEFQKLIAESREETAHFARALSEGCRKINDLALNLERDKKELIELMRSLEERGKQREEAGAVSAGCADKEEGTVYRRVLEMLATGMSVKEAAQRSGLTEGEVDLVRELKQRKEETSLGE